MDFAIQVENISKVYQLGQIGTGTLSRDLERWLSKIRGKGDPFMQVFEDDNTGNAVKPSLIKSLNDVSFTIEEGTAVGIIGANGAGKSTLLKILSRITSPTSGRVIGRGRIASLLEVGTGFHPELTGRENTYLNGAILGMKKKEIANRFDEIVDFAGVAKYIDTPVKRYSSGMYVRLAFAVAAHLDPDILIIDEVLAVGDAEFQKKCFGKMNEVSKQQGRTILFVTHNMQAIANLCSSAIWLDKGSLMLQGPSKAVVNQYLGAYQQKVWKRQFNDVARAPGNDRIKIMEVNLVPDLEDPLSPIDVRTSLKIELSFYNYSDNVNINTTLLLFTAAGECIFEISSEVQNQSPGILESTCTIPGNFLNDGGYYVSFNFTKDSSVLLYSYDECLSFDVADFREDTNWYGKCWGYVRPDFPVSLKRRDLSGIDKVRSENWLS